MLPVTSAQAIRGSGPSAEPLEGNLTRPLYRALTQVRDWSAGLSRLGQQIPDRLLRLGLGETALLLIIAACVGLLAGAAILGFYRLLAGAATFSERLAALLVLPPFWIHAAVLLAGIGLARWLVRAGTRDSQEETSPR